MAKPSALIYGYHGMGNFGDDIFLQSLVENFLEPRGIGSFVIRAGEAPIPVTANFEIKKIAAPRRLKRLVWLRMLPHMVRARYVLMCAGSIFKSQSFFLLLATLAIAKILTLGRVKIYALGVSVGPLNSSLDRFHMRLASRLFDFIGLRDHESAKYLATSRFKFVGDLAIPHFFRLAYELGQSGPPESNRGAVLGVCVSDSLVNDEHSFQALVRMIRSRSSANFEVSLKIFSACLHHAEGDDSSIAKLLHELNGVPRTVTIVVHKPWCPGALVPELATCTALISSRMHISLAGLLLGVPTLQYCYADKVRDVFPTIGVPEIVFPPVEFFPAAISRFIDRLDEYRLLSSAKDKIATIIATQNCMWSRLA